VLLTNNVMKAIGYLTGFYI